MNKEKTIKLLGIFFIIVGVLQLIFNAKDIWWSLVILSYPSSFSLHEKLFFTAVSLILCFALPLTELMAGFGIIKIKKWGWWLAIVSCIITFIANFYGTINFAIASYKFQNTPIPTAQEGAHIEFISMWPTYVYAIVSVLLIILLNQKSLKNAFRPQI